MGLIKIKTMNVELINLNLELLKSATMNVSDLDKVQLLIETLKKMRSQQEPSEEGLNKLWED